MTPRTTLPLLILAAVACGGSAGAWPVGGGEVRVAPVGAVTAAGYLVLHNASGMADTLVSASSPAARQVTFDEEMTHDGMTMMMGVLALPIAAGDSIVFAPGRRHLMFDSLTKSMVPGDSVAVTLHFARGGQLSLVLPVRMVGEN